jgi:hypothetical protein
MENYFIPFFLSILYIRFKELRKAIKIKKNVIMELLFMFLILTLSVLLYLFMKQI